MFEKILDDIKCLEGKLKQKMSGSEYKGQMDLLTQYDDSLGMKLMYLHFLVSYYCNPNRGLIYNLTEEKKVEELDKFSLPRNEGMNMNYEDDRLPHPDAHKKRCLIKFYDHKEDEVELDEKDKIFYTYHYLRSRIRKLDMSDEDIYVRFGFYIKRGVIVEE